MATQTVIKEWNKTAIGKVYSFTSKPRGLEMPEILDFIPMEAISERNEHIDKSLIKKVSEVASGTYVENGDFLVAKITPSFENGKQGFVSIDSPFAYATTEVIPIQEIEGLSDKQFIAYWLRQGKIRSVLAGKMEGTTGRQRLSKTVFANTQIFLPPLPEQKAITRVLSTVQDAIAEQEKLITKLKELKRSMMQHLFTQGTKGEKTKMTQIGEIPESWEITTVGDLCDVKGGKRLPKGQRLVSENTGLPYVRVTDFLENGVYVSNIQYLLPETQKTISRYTISVKDIYISIAGSIGFVGVIPEELDGANLTENAAKLCLKTDVVEQKFLMYWLSADQVQRDIKSQTVKNAQPKLALARIQKLPCVLPTAKEQKQISDTIDAIEKRDVSAQTKLKSYRDLFKTLLHELMSGERRVNVKI